MDPRQVFRETAVRDEFLDRFPQLKEHAPVSAGSAEGSEGAPSVDQARDVVQNMAEGVYRVGVAPALEAIIERFTRPVYLVQGSTAVAPPDAFPDSEVIAQHLAAARTRLARAIPSTGRIDLRNHRHDWAGTAWVVAPDVVVTNRHVAAEFARPHRDGFVFQGNPDGTAVVATVDWCHEFGSGHESRFRVEEVLWMEPDGSADVALLRLCARGEQGQEMPAPIPLMSPAEIDDRAPGAWVAVVGYPAFDSRNDAADQQRIFDGIFNVKRLAPGQVTYFSALPVLHHDATTLGGSSGSVVVDLDSGKAIGLHFGGIEGARNEAVHAGRVHEIVAEHLR